jgi:hypothetical protein
MLWRSFSRRLRRVRNINNAIIKAMPIIDTGTAIAIFVFVEVPPE